MVDIMHTLARHVGRSRVHGGRGIVSDLPISIVEVSLMKHEPPLETVVAREVALPRVVLEPPILGLLAR